MRHFKISISIIGILSFSFLPLTFAQVKVGQRAPDFVTSTLDGKRFALKDYLKQPDNKLLILTFFATWCDLCGEDLKYLQRLNDQYGDRGLRVFCVFTGRLSKIKAAKKYMEDLNVNLPILLDKKRVVSKRYKVPGLPCHYVIDREGIMRFKCIGCGEDVKRKFEENLRGHLGAS
jgi:peroxiredoxin